MSNQFRIGADKGNPVAFSRERIVKAQGDNFGKRIGFENRAQGSFDGTCGKSRWTVTAGNSMSSSKIIECSELFDFF